MVQNERMYRIDSGGDGDSTGMFMQKQEMRVLVATHKPYWMPRDDLYLPIQVGAAVPGRAPVPNTVADNNGINISAKNPSYCELTALYWAWKNYAVPYIGLAHYRRYFRGHGERKIAQKKDLARRLAPDTVLVPKRRRYYIETVYNHYVHAHHSAPMDLALDIIRRDYPGQVEASERVMNRTWLYLFNMFVMSKQNFDAYCEWLFAILEEIESRIDTSHWSAYETRMPGFLSERLFNIWLEARDDLAIVECPYVTLEKQHTVAKVVNVIRRKVDRRNMGAGEAP